MVFDNWQPCLQGVARLHLTIQLPATPPQGAQISSSVHLEDLASGEPSIRRTQLLALKLIPALTFRDRGLQEPIRMEVQSLRVMTSGAGTLGVQHRNLSWIFWLVLPFAAQRSHVTRPKQMAHLSCPPTTTTRP